MHQLLISFDIPMKGCYLYSPRGEEFDNLFGDSDRPVSSSSTANGDAQCLFIGILIFFDEKKQEWLEMLPKGLTHITGHYVCCDLGFFAAFWPQLGNPVGVGKKAHVTKLININWRAVFKAKRKKYNP